MTTRQGEKHHKDRPERHPDEPKHHDYEVTFSRLMAAVFVLLVVAVRLEGVGWVQGGEEGWWEHREGRLKKTRTTTQNPPPHAPLR